jgi:hypothetical protein
MSPSAFASWLFLLAGLGCDRQAPTPELGEAGPARPSSSAALLPNRALAESEAIARVRALPEFVALASEDTDEGARSRKKVPHASVVSMPRFQSTSAGDGSCWEVVVADQARFDADGGLTSVEPPDLDVCVDAYTGAVSVRNEDGSGFRDYRAWAAAQRGWIRAAALVMSTPEWKAQAAVTRSSPAGRTSGAVLSLAYGEEPSAGCRPGAPDCGYTFTAIPYCPGSCAGGLWVEFEVDPSRGEVFAKGIDSESPVAYGTWRQQFRTQVRQRHLGAYRTLLDRRQSFPERRPGEGPLGYGRASPSVGPPRCAALRTALERGGYALVRTERYAGDFMVYVVQPSKPHAPQASDLRSWGADMVRANGGRACEVLVDGSKERFQFDASALTGDSGGVYVFVDGDFHPWLKPE